MVFVPRDTVPNAAVLDLHVPRAVQAKDSVVVTLTIGTWGSLEGDTALVEIFEDARRIVSRNVVLPQSPGIGRRQVVIPSERLSLGDRVVRVALTAPGDRESRDDVRMRVISVTDLPSVVVLVDPADYEGRFLFQELNDIAQGSVRGYARVANDRWVEMGSMGIVRDAEVERATQAAALVIHRSTQGRLPIRSTIPTCMNSSDYLGFIPNEVMCSRAFARQRERSCTGKATTILVLRIAPFSFLRNWAVRKRSSPAIRDSVNTGHS